MLVVRHGADEALGGVDVVQADHRGCRAGDEIVPRGVEGHAGYGRHVCDGLECFFGRGFAVVEQLDCEVQGAGGEDRLLGVELEHCHLLRRADV